MQQEWEKNLLEKNVWYLKMGVKLNTNISKLITEKLEKSMYKILIPARLNSQRLKRKIA